MGYYIEIGGPQGKTAALVRQHQAQIVDQQTASRVIDDPTKGVIVIMHNAMFEAAGFAYNRAEFESFTQWRIKEFVVLDRAQAEKLTGFDRKRRTI